MGWLLVQPTATVLTGLALLSGVVLLLSKSVASQADRVAELIGQPYGTLVLTAAVMTIELALVASTMLTGESNPTLARDSMFSVVMIALTGVTGLCNAFSTAWRVQGWADRHGQLAAPNQLGALTFDPITTMRARPGDPQLQPHDRSHFHREVVLSIVALGVYVFLTAQIGRYGNLYIENESTLASADASDAVAAKEEDEGLSLGLASILLVVGLLIVCLIAESMGKLIETGITDLGLPSSLAGVLVALLILAPEALNAIQAASHGEVQRSINTLYGSVVATVSLTVPAVLVLGEITHTDVILGRNPSRWCAYSP